MSIFQAGRFGRIMNDRDFHKHDSAQILKVDHGVMQLHTPNRAWFIPRNHLILVPPRTLHKASSVRKVSGWWLFLKEVRKTGFSDVVSLETSSLLEALVRAILDDPRALNNPTIRAAYKTLSIREISKLREEKLFIPMPTEPKLQILAQRILKKPQKNRKIKEWAKTAGMSERNFSRRFSEDVGMSFEKWRILAIHRKAIEYLSNGEDVSSVAYALGYEAPSSFIQSFKRINGTTPGKYL